jgi:hypothetical protein
MSDEPTYLQQLRTPLDLVNRLEWVTFYLRKSTGVIHDLRNTYIAASDAYSRAYKQSKLDLRSDPNSGTVGDREDQAQLDNWQLFTQMNEAKSTLDYAKEKKADLESEQSKLQSEGRLIIKEMELSGKI